MVVVRHYLPRGIAALSFGDGVQTTLIVDPSLSKDEEQAARIVAARPYDDPVRVIRAAELRIKMSA